MDHHCGGIIIRGGFNYLTILDLLFRSLFFLYYPKAPILITKDLYCISPIEKETRKNLTIWSIFYKSDKTGNKSDKSHISHIFHKTTFGILCIDTQESSKKSDKVQCNKRQNKKKKTGSQQATPVADFQWPKIQEWLLVPCIRGSGNQFWMWILEYVFVEDRHRYDIMHHNPRPQANGTKNPLHRSVYSIQPPSLSSLKQVTFKGKISLTSHGRISFSFPSVYSAAKGNRNLRSGSVFCGSQVSRDLWRWTMWTNLPNVWSLQIFTICTKRI